ncbi:hypothetical protein ACFL9T_19245 [Thermodesulfobacteriota bacterium]
MDYFNYREYTLDRLYDARRNINGEKYPDRLAELEEEIKRKESVEHVELIPTTIKKAKIQLPF